MRDIIDAGKNKFKTICSKCGCKFSYELEDISCTNYVVCPYCNTDTKHEDMRTTKFLETILADLDPLNKNKNKDVSDIIDEIIKSPSDLKMSKDTADAILYACGILNDTGDLNEAFKDIMSKKDKE